MQAKLVVVEPLIEPREREVTLPITIGRGDEAGLQLRHDLVSRMHCELFVEQGRMFVRDLGSLNGTFVGGQRVDVARVRPGDLLTIGSVTLRAIYGEEVYVAPSKIVSGEAGAGIETVALEDTAQVSYKPREEPAGEPLGLSDSRGDFFKSSDN